MDTGLAENADEAYWMVKGFDGEGKFDHLRAAIVSNDTEAFAAAMDELTSNGVADEKAAEKAKAIIAELYKGTDEEAASISESEAVSYLVKFAGKTNAEAQLLVDKWSFVGASEDYGDISESAVAKYNEYCLPAVISKQDYFDTWKFTSNVRGEDYDGDGDIDKYSALDKKLDYINRLALTSAQKTALAYAMRISEKSIYERAPW